MFGVRHVSVSDPLYRHATSLCAFVVQPISCAPFQSMAVKWPTTPVLPSVQPGKEPQSATSPYQLSTASAGEGVPELQYKFSPAGPAGAATLYESECCISAWAWKVLSASWYTASSQMTGLASCMQR